MRALSYTLGDVELGRDATDEAMARTYANWSTVCEYANPAGWTYRVGLNWARSIHRRLARQLPIIGRGEVAPPEVRDPLVAEALRSLDVDLRAVVVCRLLADWSVDQTAEALDIRPGTVKSRLHRALALLETKLHHTQELS
ncbi:MAG: sigma factor-like helix-turn-helix DNA-binding protein [Acidimicrobiales bacterium]